MNRQDVVLIHLFLSRSRASIAFASVDSRVVLLQQTPLEMDG